jgi:hypothetical protein
MNALYLKRITLPTLLLSLLIAACDSEPPSRQTAAPVSNRYLEAVQEAEAAKHALEERNQNQQRIDELLGRNQPPTR